jgi:hypothetical protein
MPHPTPPRASMYLLESTEKNVLPPQVHMNVNTFPTPPQPADVHETARPSKGRAPTCWFALAPSWANSLGQIDTAQLCKHGRNLSAWYCPLLNASGGFWGRLLIYERFGDKFASMLRDLAENCLLTMSITKKASTKEKLLSCKSGKTSPQIKGKHIVKQLLEVSSTMLGLSLCVVFL